MSRPPPWQMPLTAAETTGLRELRIASNRTLSMWRRPARVHPAVLLVARRVPPGMNTSPVPVITRAARSSVWLTWSTA